MVCVAQACSNRNAQNAKIDLEDLSYARSAQAGLHDSAVITLPIQPIIQARLEGLSIIPARGKIKNMRTFAMSGYGELGRLIPLRSMTSREE
jgi:hypothetical protein